MFLALAFFTFTLITFFVGVTILGGFFFVLLLLFFVFFFLFFERFIFFEDCATRSGGCLHFLANQILLGFDHAGGKFSGFFFADVGFLASIVGFGGFNFAAGGNSATNFLDQVFRDGLVRFRCFNAFRRGAGKKPTGQTATGAAWSVCGSGLAGYARLRFF